ncbi:MAG TPA: hypothetical protein VF198_14385 [Vicinamibacterales bacterium]
MESPIGALVWAGPFLAILCLLAAAGTRHPGFLIAAAVAVLPFSIDLAMMPALQGWALLLAVLPVVAFVAARRRVWWGVAGSLAIFVGWIGWIAWIVRQA